MLEYLFIWLTKVVFFHCILQHPFWRRYENAHSNGGLRPNRYVLNNVLLACILCHYFVLATLLKNKICFDQYLVVNFSFYTLVKIFLFQNFCYSQFCLLLAYSENEVKNKWRMMIWNLFKFRFSKRFWN